MAANTTPTRSGTPTVRTGSILAGFQSFTITQATSLTNQSPSLDWVSPNAGTGASQMFTFAASDPKGATNLRNINVDFVRFGSNMFVCQVSYVIHSFTTASGVFEAGGSLGFLTDDQKTSPARTQWAWITWRSKTASAAWT